MLLAILWHALKLSLISITVSWLTHHRLFYESSVCCPHHILHIPSFLYFCIFQIHRALKWWSVTAIKELTCRVNWLADCYYKLNDYMHSIIPVWFQVFLWLTTGSLIWVWCSAFLTFLTLLHLCTSIFSSFTRFWNDYQLLQYLCILIFKGYYLR